MNNDHTFIDRIIQNRLLSHLIFWGGFLFVFTLLATLHSGSFRDHLINYIALLPVQIMAAYVLVYYQVPRLLLLKKYVLFMLSFLGSAYVFAVIARISVVYLAEPFIRTDFEQESIAEIISDPLYLFSIYFPMVYIMAFLLLALKSIKERFEEKHQIEILKKEKATNELKFLKAQIHPHFLFNTLNNLYALTMAKSDVAPKVVVKLSEMLDYMLYQCNEPSISIDKEIELIQHYIDLEMLRYGNRVKVDFNHQLSQSNTQVAPLLLLSLIENAFKHGVSTTFSNPVIRIDLVVKDEALYFSISNSKPIHVTAQPIADERNGIGMTNVKRQLELNYPNQHELEIDETTTTYTVSLKIDLN